MFFVVVRTRYGKSGWKCTYALKLGSMWKEPWIASDERQQHSGMRHEVIRKGGYLVTWLRRAARDRNLDRYTKAASSSSFLPAPTGLPTAMAVGGSPIQRG